MPPKKKRKNSSEPKKEETPTPVGEEAGEQAPDSAFEYKVEEMVLAHHRNMLYPAKVLKRRVKKTGEPSYFIHYQGWNSKWDEWVDPARLKAHNEENLKEREALAKKGKGSSTSEESDNGNGRKGSKSKGSRKKRKGKEESDDDDDDDDDDDTVEPEKPKSKENGTKKEEQQRVKCEIKIKIPGSLKKQLVNDWEWVTRDKKLVDLPKKKHSVTSVMDDYLNSKKRPAAAQKITDEVVTGIKQYFDRAVGRVLLYKFERPQFKELSELKQTNCDIYGAEHLLRLFVKLPELLASTDMEKDEVTVLQGKIGELVRFIEKKRSDYFSDNGYITTDKDYHEKAAQET